MKKNLSIIIALIAFITAGCSSANSKEDTGKDKGDAYQQNIENNNNRRPRLEERRSGAAVRNGRS